YAQYLNQLSVLTGRSSSSLASVLDKPRPVPAIPGKISAGLPADLLLSRPDVRAAERDYEVPMPASARSRPCSIQVFRSRGPSIRAAPISAILESCRRS